jgi:hypothetical protein
MKNFSNFMRHFQLINCKIVVYACKELKCMLRGESFEPTLTPENIQEYMEDLKSGTMKKLPMGGYEYSCCVEYLKKIKRELIKSRCKSKFMMLTFDEYEPGVVCPPLEDCLEMVAKEVGFAVVYEEVKGNKYIYTLKCTLGEKQ